MNSLNFQFQCNCTNKRMFTDEFYLFCFEEIKCIYYVYYILTEKPLSNLPSGCNLFDDFDTVKNLHDVTLQYDLEDQFIGNS